MGFLNFSIFLCCMYSTSVAHQKHTPMYVMNKKATPFCSASITLRVVCRMSSRSSVSLKKETCMNEQKSGRSAVSGATGMYFIVAVE